MSQSFSSRKRSYWRIWAGVMVERCLAAKVERRRSDSRVPRLRDWSVYLVRRWVFFVSSIPTQCNLTLSRHTRQLPPLLFSEKRAAGGGGWEGRTGQPRAHGLCVLARPSEGLNLEAGALKLANGHLALRDGVNWAAMRLTLPSSCRSGRGGAARDSKRRNEPPGGAAKEGLP